MTKARREILDSAKTGTITRRAARKAVREVAALRDKSGSSTIVSLRAKDNFRLGSISTKRDRATREPGLDSRHTDDSDVLSSRKK